MTEIWRDIPGYEGLYQASNRGNIRSLNWRKRGVIRNLYLKPHTKGYLQVELSKNGVKKMITVHRLVATTFIPNPNNLPTINHKDENKKNNNILNLEWCTSSYNTSFSKSECSNKDELFNKQSDKNVPYKHNQRVAQIDVLSGNTVKIWKNIATIKNEKKYNTSGIRECCKGNRNTAYGFKWQFAN